MDEVALAVILGMLPLLILPSLSSLSWCLLIAILTWGIWLIRHRFARLSAILLLSFVWAVSQGQYLLLQTDILSRGKVEIIASVQSINLGRLDKHQVVMRISEAAGKRVFPPILFRTQWENTAANYCAGQTWRVIANLRPVHAVLNEGGFDSQRWALANHWPLQGRIEQGTVLLDSCNLRQRFITAIGNDLLGFSNRAILIALGFGEKGLISQQDNALLQKTGIAHLVAISGLHIGIAAWVGWLFARGLQYFLPLRFIDYRFPLIVSEVVLLMYTWLAGCNAPALRAALALSLWLALRFYRVRCHPWQVWLWGIAFLLLMDPMSILSDSFWLSCLAVAALIFWFQWAPLSPRFSRHWYWAPLRWAHLQWGMTLLLLPMQIGLFHGLNYSSFMSNMWAVPIVSLFTVPLVLLGLITHGIFPTGIKQIIWSVADHSLSIALWGVRKFVDDWFFLGASTFSLAFAGWVGVMAWRLGWLLTYPGNLLAMVAVITVWLNAKAPERWRVDMIDVGHGLATLISKNGKGILYDTGNRWEKGSAAEMNILPFIRWHNIAVEQIIISHSHEDHRGGLESVKRAFPFAVVRESSVSAPLSCLKGVGWKWQGLTFKVFWPEKLTDRPMNDDSCVIRIDDGKFSVLLTGDIEAAAERKLVSQYHHELNATVMQVPHHGSNTSSTAPFLRAVSPKLSIASASRFNQWHLPAKKVVNRYDRAGLAWRDTAHSGQLTVHFYDDHWSISGLREQLFPRWYHRRFGVSGDNE
ncbi:MAG: ComEC family protein [Ewingella sp.]